MSKLASFFVGALVASLIAVMAMSFFGSTEAEAAVSAPVASQSTPLELDQSGLPKGSLVFYLDGATCVAVPGIGVSCFCCEECNECEELECEECAPCTVSDTYTSASGAYTATFGLPTSDVSGSTSSNEEPPSSDGELPSGSEEPPATVYIPDDTPPDDGEEPPADNPNAGPKGNNGLGNGVDPAPPGIAKQGKPQNDDPAVPGDPQYKGKGSDGEPNGKGGKSDEAPGQSKDKGK